MRYIKNSFYCYRGIRKWDTYYLCIDANSETAIFSCSDRYGDRLHFEVRQDDDNYYQYDGVL